MIDQKFIDKSSVKVFLEKVSYQNIGMPANLNRDSVVSSRTVDSYEILSITDKNMELRFMRKVFFTPRVFMEANVQMRVKLKLTDQERNAREEEIKSELAEKIDELLQLPICNASFILSSITSVSMPLPLITPPYFLEEEDDDDD